jgi:hypothetical protein
MRKPRSDSRLKTLPEERQEQIAEYARGHSLAETVTWLKEDGFVTSAAALSEWLSWYLLRDQLERNANTVESVLDELKRSRPDLTEAELFAAGQAFFSALAIEQRDAKSWKRTQDLRIKSQALKIEEARFQRDTCELFLKWSADQRANAIVESKAGNAEKIEALRQLMFGDLASAAGPLEAQS